MITQQEQKNKRIAMMISIGFHAVLLIAFLLLMAWRAPNPPHPEYGIELNFGLDQQGGGEVQPEKAPGTETNTPDPQPEEAQETPQEQSPAEVQPVKAEEPIVSKIESPVVVKKEEKKEPTKEPVKENKTETKAKVEPKEEVKKVEPKEAVKTEYKPTETKPADKKGEGGTSHGDDPGKVGDKGNPEGKLDDNGQYKGKPGGGDNGEGFGLGMSGWDWADQPKIPTLPDNQGGRIEFKITCDENGDIYKIETISRGLSLEAEKILRAEILKNSLVKKSSGQAQPSSTGTVVFILKTK
ncbi:MAG: cell envelope integrity protein TolA [Cytophagales bacterium]|nr:cell envelope integrity protein TolA [Cytophagales bacterium]